MHLADLIPDAETLLALEPDELGLKILPVLASWPQHQQRDLTTLCNATLGPANLPAQGHRDFGHYPGARRTQIVEALTEAWTWLEGAALLVPDHNFYGNHGIRVLS